MWELAPYRTSSAMLTFSVLLLGMFFVTGQKPNQWRKCDFPTKNDQNRRFEMDQNRRFEIDQNRRFEVDRDYPFHGYDEMPMVPSSQYYPVSVVSPGKDAIINCNGSFSTRIPVVLVKDKKFIQSVMDGFGNPIRFSIANVKQEDGGLYKCCHGWSETFCRKAMELLIRDPFLTRPEVSFRPITVGIGEDFSIRCRSEREGRQFYFQKDGREMLREPSPESVITIQRASERNAGNYSCSYSFPFVMSEPSAPKELLITDTSLLRPVISSNAGMLVALGMQVTIQCEIESPAVIFYLHKAGNSARRIMQTDGRIGKYYFRNFSLKDQGWYSCSCARLASPFVVSERSNFLELLLSDEESHETQHTVLIAVGVCATLLILFLLLVLLWCKRRRDALLEATQTSGERSFHVLRARRVTKSAGTSTAGGQHMEKQPPKNDQTTQPEDIIYAELRRDSLDSQEEADDGIVYATVIIR